jgi:hypothetical protein
MEAIGEIKVWEDPTMDRSRWGSGPWDTEPDKVSWIDAATGLDCLIVRGSVGSLCGYAGVLPTHPWHGAEYGYGHFIGPKVDEECENYCVHNPDHLIDVHGGLTYSDRCQSSDDPAQGICHVPAPGRPEDVWWFGFDCAHYGDQVPSMASTGESYWTVDLVTIEVLLLAGQLAKVA